MSRMLMTAALLAGGMLPTGCSTYAATRYASSANNVVSHPEFDALVQADGAPSAAR